MKHESITRDTAQALEELLAEAKLEPGKVLVVGCSTSEVAGEKIGTCSTPDIAAAIFKALLPACRQQGIFLAIQCCEHLNRALVVEKDCLDKYCLEEVSVYPVKAAGGSMAVEAMRSFTNPVVVENIQAHAGMDIGDTFIGMHIKPVLVPVRGTIKKIGEAHLTMGRSRPKLIGGERARYKPI
ncbi:MAG: TIGR01440 family protein [Desulfocucumaceae bacterium]